MLELKYFKELPCRSLNNNSHYVQLAGADLYNDKDGNRYAFISVKNCHRTPFFSLYLYIKQYDSSGAFLKDDKFSVPTIYGTPGIHVINEPIPLEKGCDGIEVFIYLAEYTGHNFYNDSFSKAGREKVTLDLSKVKSKPRPTSNTKLETVTPVREEKETSYEDNDEREVEEAPISRDVNSVTSTSSVKKAFTLINIYSLPVAILIFIILIIFVCMVAVPLTRIIAPIPEAIL